MTEAGRVAGWRALAVGDDVLRAIVLPERGAELHSLVHVPTEMELLFQAPWGLHPPSPERTSFLDRYAGGWQELFPSANDETTYGGETIPFHGEVALLPWECEERDEALVCRVRCERTPFLLERTLRFDGRLVVEERVTNEGDDVAHFTWGHHLVLGPPFLEAGSRLEVPARTIVTIPELWEDTARLEPGQRSPWPHARLREGGTVDLRIVPGPEAASHDDVYLTDLDDGLVTVESSRLRVRLGFDHELFRWLISWQPYGGALEEPLAGSYALGIEPWVSRLPLGQAVEAGEAIELPPGASLETTLWLAVEEI
ncbi:MAG TPA: aldose 1-epimerase [Gaiellaceae bacterium]|nr:aldose 1-epimerase [Gaiellaceae bacterium]